MVMMAPKGICKRPAERKKSGLPHGSDHTWGEMIPKEWPVGGGWNILSRNEGKKKSSVS